MVGLVRVCALYNGTELANAACGETLSVQTITETDGLKEAEYHAIITNRSDRTVTLNRVILLEAEQLSGFGLSSPPYRIYRSGRHKNDMPGVFETGCADDRLRDVSAVMSESGDHLEGTQGRRVVSDHLTLIRDRTGTCLEIAFLTGRDQLFQTCLDLDEEGNLIRISAETVFQILLDPGESVRTESIRLAVTDDPEQEIERFAERKAQLYGRRNKRCPSVFCTWYYYGLTVTYQDVIKNLQEIRGRRLPYEVFQVDEGWEKTLGEYEPNEKFPVPMKRIAEQIRAAGCLPGLWSSPFVAHETASVWQAHPEWILRDGEGNPCLFPMNDTVYQVVDITQPATWDYFRELYRRFTFDWGYLYHKLDFTRAAVIFENAAFADRRMTLAQAYYRAVRAIREGMGEEAFLVMCGGLYDPIIGLVDAQRTGSDVLSMWSSSIQTGGKTAPYTIRQSLERYYMNRWWANDPDALMIRRNAEMERGLRLTYGLLNDEEVKTSVINQFAGGGIMCQTEPLDRIDEDRLAEIRHILPVTERITRPVRFLSGDRFPDCMDVFLPETGAHCVCLINWSDTEEKRISLCLSDLPLDPAARYAACEFYSGDYQINASAGDTVSFGTLKPHGATVVKIEKMGKAPLIVRSDGHYSMGAECSQLALKGNRLRISLRAPAMEEIHYGVLLPEEAGDGIREVSVTIPKGEAGGETEI